MDENVDIYVSWYGQPPSDSIMRQVVAYELAEMDAPQSAWEAVMEFFDDESETV